MGGAVAEDRADERLARADAKGDRLAEPATVLAGAPGVVAQRLALDDQRREVLGDLHRRAEHARRERGRGETVLHRARAGAPRGEEDVAERLARHVLPG